MEEEKKSLKELLANHAKLNKKLNKKMLGLRTQRAVVYNQLKEIFKDDILCFINIFNENCSVKRFLETPDIHPEIGDSFFSISQSSDSKGATINFVSIAHIEADEPESLLNKLFESTLESPKVVEEIKKLNAKHGIKFHFASPYELAK